jgi:hypothetical protein
LVGVLACLQVINAIGVSLSGVLFGLFGIVFGLVILVAEISVLMFSIEGLEVMFLY